MGADGANPRPLTGSPPSDGGPSLSPDGRFITFESDHGERPARACSSTSSALLVSEDSLDELAWASGQIIIGRLVEKLPSAWGEQLNPDVDDCLPICTDLIVEVEQAIRVEPADQVRVRLPGGTIGPYTQTVEPRPDLGPGDRALLFLQAPRGSDLLPPASTIVGSIQGVWRISAGDTVETGRDPAHDGQPLGEVARQIRAALGGSPAVHPPLPVVPLVTALLAPEG